MRKERPILFSAPMVKAIESGTKTQTRRTNGLKALNEEKVWVYNHNSNTGEVIRPAKKYDSDPWYIFYPHNSNEESWIVQCPYGKPGDILWVRETWTDEINGQENHYPFYKAKCPYVWDNDGEEVRLEASDLKWKPSIFMPKEYCRIWLEITNVRVERLNDISEEDADNEGVYFGRTYETSDSYNGFRDYITGVNDLEDARTSFISLWGSINGEESWESNPWVWAIEFKRIEKL